MAGSRDQEIIALIPRLRRYARALTGHPDQADDLVQDCLERGLNRFHLWREGSDLRAWLFTIMHNIHINDRRRPRNRFEISGIDDESLFAGSVAPNQEDVVALNSVVGALRRLPEDQRAVILLIGLEELSYREVADILGVPVGTVMSRLSRGRERLRELAGEGIRPRSRSVP